MVEMNDFLRNYIVNTQQHDMVATIKKLHSFLVLNSTVLNLARDTGSPLSRKQDLIFFLRCKTNHVSIIDLYKPCTVDI